jgi:putative SOS response-associated peptidase YedK
MTRFAEVDWHPRYNVAPSQVVETILSVNGEKRVGPMRCGSSPVAVVERGMAASVGFSPG